MCIRDSLCSNIAPTISNFDKKFVKMALNAHAFILVTLMIPDGFNFFIVRFPYACSNIPSKIFLSTIGAETLRICRASSCFEHFIRFCQLFFSSMINQGANVVEIKSVFVKFFKRHETIFSKFNKTSEQIIVELKF